MFKEKLQGGHRAKEKRQGKRGRVEDKGGSDRWGGHTEKRGAKQRGKERGQEEREISEVGAWSKKEWCRKRTIMEIREEM